MDKICQHLEWDSQFFGYNIARINDLRVSSTTLNQAITWSVEQGIECLYFLCSAEDRTSVKLAESAGFHLVDVRVELNWRVESLSDNPADAVRGFQESDLTALQQIASQVYTNTRFSFDEHFSAEQVSELYKEWLTGSCRNSLHKVFVAIAPNGIAGFITCQFDSAEVGRIGLLGLQSDVQGQGYGQQLVREAQRFFRAAGVREARVVTQGRNVAAQRLYQSCSFRTTKVNLWYHKWF